MDFKDYFTRGSHGTLRLKNNTQFSYMNPWKQLYTDTIIDEWHVGEIMSAEYTIVVANGINAKETIKAIVIASPEAASIAIIGRASIANNMVNVDVAVNNSTLQLKVSPASGESAGAKVMFSATYYQNLSS
jgi:hypothetical protein